MTTQEKIIRNIEMISSIGYGSYKTEESVRVAIAMAMGFETRRMIGGKVDIPKYEEFEKAHEILKEMISNGTLVRNKRGGLVKLNTNK